MPTLRARKARALITFSSTRSGSKSVVYGDVVAGEIDALHSRAAAAGAEMTAAPHDTDYGSRDFALRDPEGNRWSFGTCRGEPATPAYEMRRWVA